ncbi:MAG: universal stress protein [Cyanobacteria bacterium SIG32]|nr:universal stress protein [Cyanobacteria bacterium SIG32]
MRILFCTDGSKLSFNALRNFSDYVCGDVIVDVICVIDWSFLPDDVVIEETGFVNNCRNVADTVLEKSKLLIEELGLIVGDVIKHCGSAVETILEQTEKQCYEFVVLGSHGKKGLQRWLGSVSREILDETSLPVYVSKVKNKDSRILFATDGSEFSDKIVDFAIDKLCLERAKIFVCSVSENPDLLFLDGTLDSNWLLAIQAQQEIYAEHAINKVKDKLQKAGISNLESSVISGSPTVSIIDYIKEKEIDLVILGSRLKTKMEKFLIDSVSKRVIEHSQCDSLIIKTISNN